MVMDTLQIRLTKGLIDEIQKLVDRQIYSSVSEAIRDAVRKMVVGGRVDEKTAIVKPDILQPISPEVQKAKEEVQIVKQEVQQAIEKEIKGELQRARGTRDFLPESQIVRQQIIDTLKETFELYGYSPLETPVIERFDVLSSKYAGGAEILKETFTFRDQGNRELALRYDDVDAVGSKEMTADAEILSIMKAALQKLGFDSEIKVNNRKILDAIMIWAGVEAEKTETVMLSLDKLEKFGKDAVIKELIGKGLSDDMASKILGTIGIQGENAEKILALKSVIGDIEGLKEIESLLDLLDSISVSVSFDPSLARGLAYYTGTIYETFIKGSAITSSVCSGGRWDNMIGQFLGRGDSGKGESGKGVSENGVSGKGDSGKGDFGKGDSGNGVSGKEELGKGESGKGESGKGKYPAVGTSFGLDRLYDAVIARAPGMAAKKTVTKVFVIPIGTLKESLKAANELRAAGVRTEIDIMGRGVSKNLNYANSLGIPYVIFIGEEEMKVGKVKLRNMADGKEKLISIQEILKGERF
ncbi:ATP phosphoribosyltransferase regulatory subunit [Candidatus Woesearchaeota archaeon]|nr:ATP phosphoribosyltransferase regulatory subunit [Candidatus Woesearchaeota archaeon]